MAYFLYYIITLTAISALVTVAQIGKQRLVITPGAAVAIIVLASANIVGYVWVLSRVS